jgi:hypothetical protein
MSKKSNKPVAEDQENSIESELNKLIEENETRSGAFTKLINEFIKKIDATEKGDTTPKTTKTP